MTNYLSHLPQFDQNDPMPLVLKKWIKPKPEVEGKKAELEDLTWVLSEFEKLSDTINSEKVWAAHGRALDRQTEEHKKQVAEAYRLARPTNVCREVQAVFKLIDGLREGKEISALVGKPVTTKLIGCGGSPTKTLPSTVNVENSVPLRFSQDRFANHPVNHPVRGYSTPTFSMVKSSLEQVFVNCGKAKAEKILREVAGVKRLKHVHESQWPKLLKLCSSALEETSKQLINETL